MAAPTTRIEDKSLLNIYSQHTTVSSFPDETNSRLMASCHTIRICVLCAFGAVIAMIFIQQQQYKYAIETVTTALGMGSEEHLI